MSAQPSEPRPDSSVPLPTSHVLCVVTVDLDGPRGRGKLHWHVRDLDTGVKILSQSYELDGDRFDHDYCCSRALKAMSDVWACCGPF